MSSEFINITKVIEQIERHCGFKYAALYMAVIFCIGGNDFIPKLYGFSHEKWVTTVLAIPNGLHRIIDVTLDESRDIPTKRAVVNKELYLQTTKTLFCPKTYNEADMSINEVRQLSTKTPGKDARHPSTWMPPPEAIDRLITLLNCQLEYLLTLGEHGALLLS